MSSFFKRLASNQHGFTLIELVIGMVVVSIALGGVLLVMNQTVGRSADPVVEHQAVAIAEAYLEEIMTKAYSDPGGPAESGRADYDDVDDYHGLSDSGAHDQFGNTISGLGDYTVNVSVSGTSLNGESAKQVTVSVRHPIGINITLTGFRTDY